MMRLIEIFKDLPRITASDKVLCDKAFNIVKNPKYEGYQWGLPSVVCNFFDKMSASGSGVTTFANKSAIKNQSMLSLEQAEEQLENIRGVDLFDMQLRNKFVKETCFTLCVMNIFSKSTRFVYLKDKKSLQPLMIFKIFYMNQDANQTKYG